MAEQTAAHKKIMEEAAARYKRGMERESVSRAHGDEDTKMAYADSYNGWAWPQKLLSDRQGENRPALTINKVMQHCLQVINDARQNKATVRIRPVGGGATYQAAQCLEGIIRHIEYQSNATAAYDKATNDQVIPGIGYVFLETDYVGADSFDQEIYIRRVPDPKSILMDCDIQEYDGSDANWGFISSHMSDDEFKATYPKATVGAKTSLDGGSFTPAGCTLVTKYFRREMKDDTLYACEDGSTIKGSEVAGTELLDQLKLAVKDKESGVRMRKILTPNIQVFKFAGSDIVEESEWAGAYIPIARCVGTETVVDGVLDRYGHVRAMLDAQRMYNYWTSCAVEFGALQSKAPFIGSAEAIEGREEEWARANTSNPAILTHNAFDEQSRPLAAPVRSQPPVASSAYTQGMQTAAQELMSVSGQYQSELGMPGNEKSGVAIDARQRQSNTAVAHFSDHQAMMIRHIGRMLVDLIPKIYDTKRVIRILAEDGSDVEATVDPNHSDAHSLTPNAGTQPSDSASVFTAAKTAALIFNPGVGRYDVQADVGPNFGTQRQEAFNMYSQILQTSPTLLPIIGDLMFKAMDAPGADEIAHRMEEQRAGSMVPAAHMQAAQQQMQQLHQILLTTTEALADEKRKNGAANSNRDIQTYEAETRRMAAVAQVDPDALRPLIRQLVSDVLGEDALPHIQAHMPDTDDAPDPMAASAQAHGQAMDVAKLGLAAQAQDHAQGLAMAQHGLAVQQAQAPAAQAPSVAE